MRERAKPHKVEITIYFHYPVLCLQFDYHYLLSDGP